MSKYNELFLTTTDTVIGMGAPVSKENREAIYDLKQRPKEKGLIIMVGSLEQARKLEGWNEKAEKLAKENWPGQVTLVLSEEIAVRMPGQQGLCNLILQKGPCYMTSANISGERTITSLDEAKSVFQEITNYYDFGEGSGKPSKIIRVENGEVLR